MNKLTEDTLMVQPLDQNKVLAFVTPLLPQLPEHTKYTANASAFDSIIVSRLICVDDDCCWGFLEEQQMFHDGINQGILYVTIGTSKESLQENGLPQWSNKGNVYNIPISAETQLPGLLKEPVTLKEHMGRRYGYNPRIMNNLRSFLKDVNNLGIDASSNPVERSVATSAQ